MLFCSFRVWFLFVHVEVEYEGWVRFLIGSSWKLVLWRGFHSVSSVEFDGRGGECSMWYSLGAIDF